MDWTIAQMWMLYTVVVIGFYNAEGAGTTCTAIKTTHHFVHIYPFKL